MVYSISSLPCVLDTTLWVLAQSATESCAAMVTGFSDFQGTQMKQDKCGLTREALDAFPLESHRRAARATLSGAFNQGILPIEVQASRRLRLHRSSFIVYRT
jgi:acetyl-CoA acetyltransferase